MLIYPEPGGSLANYADVIDSIVEYRTAGIRVEWMDTDVYGRGTVRVERWQELECQLHFPLAVIEGASLAEAIVVVCQRQVELWVSAMLSFRVVWSEVDLDAVLVLHRAVVLWWVQGMVLCWRVVL